MHEYSIVQSLLNLCEENARANNATKVTSVEVKIGVMSGVEPHLLEIAFDTFKEKTLCDTASLVMHVQEVRARCRACGEEFSPTDGRYTCIRCESTDLDVVDGEEMYLMRLEME